MSEVNDLSIELSVLNGKLWVTLYGRDESGALYSISDDCLEADEVRALLSAPETVE